MVDFKFTSVERRERLIQIQPEVHFGKLNSSYTVYSLLYSLCDIDELTSLIKDNSPRVSDQLIAVFCSTSRKY